MPSPPAAIVVAAGANGAGKSSIVQPFVERNNGAYFNPDQYAHALVVSGIKQAEANQIAWARGYRELVRAVERNRCFAFETTLGGHSIAFQLMRALALDRRVLILFVGLASVELHLQRVRERVERGGHDIPEARIRERHESSRVNLLAFIGTRATIRVWDNSTQTHDARPGAATEIFRVENRRLVLPEGHSVAGVVGWTRPLVAKALELGL